MSEAAWNKAFTQGSRALQDRLKKVHANNPKFQSWMQKSGHATDTSVKQASKEVKKSERAKTLQAKSIQAYGATKGAKVGGEYGSAEMRDTIKPLTRDQHSKIQAAERAAKAAAKAANPKPVKPAKPKTPLSKDERIAAIRRAVAKNKAKDRFDVPTVDPDDMDHDDLRDVHNQMHVRKTYNEAVGPYASGPVKVYTPAEIEAMNRERGTMPGEKAEEQPKKKAPSRKKETGLRKKPGSLRRIIGSHKYHSYIGNVSGYAEKSSKKSGMNRFEEVELDEVTKQEAEKALGGPVKTRTGSEPKGKLPLGFRRARNLARKAIKTVKESTTEVLEVNEMNHGKKLAKMIMAKQSQHSIAQNMGEQNIVEQDDSMEKKEMAQTQLHFIKYAAEEILEFIDMGGEVEEWYQNKLSKVQSEVESLHSYIEGEKRRTGMVEEVEQVDEKMNLVKAKMGDVVKDFYKSKAPQFKGKSMAKRREMAVAAKLGAEREAGMREEVEQVDEQSPAEIKAKYYHDQFDKVKPVKAYDKEGKLVGRYRSMDHAKQMKPGHTYKVEEEIALDEMDKSQPSSSRGAEGLALGKKADPVKTDKVKSDALKLLQKQYKKVKEEVVTEAEGKVAVTSKEKELAAHHGDKTRITYGDVIKARLKSAAAKKMGNK